MANTQPAPFGELFSSAWALVKERMNVLVPGVILFTVLTVVLQIPLAGLDEQSAAPSPENIGIATVASVASALAGIIGYLYYLLSATGKDQSMGTILKKTLPRIFPFIGLSILILLRTFAWISLIGAALLAYGGYAAYAGISSATVFLPLGMLLVAIGAVCGLILGPRYMLAPVLWVIEGTGVSAAIARSYAVSQGYWGKILGNTLLLALIFMVIMIGVGIVSGIVGGIGGAIGGPLAGDVLRGILTAFFSQFYNVVLIAFLLKLSATLIANPRGPAAPAAPAVSAAPKPVKAAAPAPVASKASVKKAPAKAAPKKAVSKKKKA